MHVLVAMCMHACIFSDFFCRFSVINAKGGVTYKLKCTNITVEELKKQHYCVECKNGNSDLFKILSPYAANTILITTMLVHRRWVGIKSNFYCT